jgi:1-acyl-sn-glycerol-3-phosphate acyltransferase
VKDWEYKPAQDLGISQAERLRSVQRESGLVGFLARKTWWFWVRIVLRLTERIQVEGKEHLPASPPFLIIANHASHLDVLVLATAYPSVCVTRRFLLLLETRSSKRLPWLLLRQE